MTFAQVSTCDRELIESFTARYAGNTADWAMHSLFCWGETLPSFRCIEDGFLIIRIHFPEQNSILYSVPMGCGDFSHLIPMLEADAQSLDVPLRFLGGDSESRAIIRKILPHYGVYHLRSASDYIYSREDLQNLKGRRYQPKRNHLNHFLATYDFKVEPLAKERTAECLEMLEIWEKEHISRLNSSEDIQIGQSQASVNSIHTYLKELEHEKVCIRKAFENWDQLGFTGIVLYAKEKDTTGGSYKMAAFCYGSKINDSTFCTHIEKALESVEGSYAAINQFMAKSLPSQFAYINREDDMGHTGLRTAKESYHPVGLEHKFIMAPMTVQMQQIRSLWLECFPEESSEDAEQFLFTHFKAENMLCHIEEGRIVSMLHIIPFENQRQDNTESDDLQCNTPSGYAYIYAVATSKEYRKRGIAGRLIEQAIERCRKEGFDFVCLIPSDDRLREWYSKYGFTLSSPISFHTTDQYDFGTGDTSRDIAAILPLTGKTPDSNKVCVQLI